MIAVDANVIAYLWIRGPRTAAAERVLEKDADWIAPALWRSEIRSVAAGHLRAGDLTLDACLAIIGGAEAQMRGREFDVPTEAVMDLVARSQASAYDCEYVALAMDMGVRLVSNDLALGREFPGTVVGMKEFAGRR